MPVPQYINFLWGGHLARPLQQARCLFHNLSISCGVGILPAHFNRQDACSTTYQFLVGWASCPPTSTGKMPVPQHIKFLVGWASCPPTSTGKMPVPQHIKFLVGWASCPPKGTGKMPVPQHIKLLWGGHLARPKKTYLSPFYTLNFSTIRRIASSTFSRLLNAEMRK
jgi:hypothetical protein